MAKTGIPRYDRVLELLEEHPWMTAPQIASTLHLCPATVRKYVSAMYYKGMIDRRTVITPTLRPNQFSASMAYGPKFLCTDDEGRTKADLERLDESAAGESVHE